MATQARRLSLAVALSVAVIVIAAAAQAQAATVRRSLREVPADVAAAAGPITCVKQNNSEACDAYDNCVWCTAVRGLKVGTGCYPSKVRACLGAGGCARACRSLVRSCACRHACACRARASQRRPGVSVAAIPHA